MANIPVNPLAKPLSQNPSGSFFVSWSSGAEETAGGSYIVRISDTSPPFATGTPQFNHNITASRHQYAGSSGDYVFAFSASAQYSNAVAVHEGRVSGVVSTPDGWWPLSASTQHFVQISSTTYDSKTDTHIQGNWVHPAPYSGSLVFTTSASIASVPGEPTIAFGSKATDEITFTWSDVATATNYKYYYGTSANPTSPGSTTGDVNTKTISSLSAGTTYYFRLKANNATGDSGYSNELTIDTLTATITDLTLSDNKPTRNDVAWTAPTGTANSYLVAGTSTDPTSVISTQSGTGAKTYEHTGLTPGTTYYYRVRTQTTNHNSTYSAYSDNESQANPSLDLPTSMGYTATTHSINFDFTEPATWGERVYIFDTSGNTLLKTGTANNFIAVDASGDSNWDTDDWTTNAGAALITGGNQSLTVKYKGYYDGAYTSFTSTVVGYSLPAPPTTFAAAAVSDEQINLTWGNPTGSALSETFTIQKKVSGGSFSDVITAATGTSYSNTGLAASTNYIYQIRTNTTGTVLNSVYTGSTVNATTQAGADVSPGDNLSLGALGKAVGVNGDTETETFLAADGRGSTGTQTRMQDFTTSAVSTMTVPGPQAFETGAEITATISFANVGTLFLGRIASIEANFTWEELTNTSKFELDTSSDYTAPIVIGDDGGLTFTFRGKFADSFNDHADSYNTFKTEEVFIIP